MVHEVVDRVSGGSAEPLVQHLLRDTRLTDGHLRAVARLLQEHGASMTAELLQLTQTRIRRGVLRSVQELVAANEDCMAHDDDDARAFAWTATVDAILQRVGKSTVIPDGPRTASASVQAPADSRRPLHPAVGSGAGIGTCVGHGPFAMFPCGGSRWSFAMRPALRRTAAPAPLRQESGRRCRRWSRRSAGRR